MAGSSSADVTPEAPPHANVLFFSCPPSSSSKLYSLLCHLVSTCLCGKNGWVRCEEMAQLRKHWHLNPQDSCQLQIDMVAYACNLGEHEMGPREPWLGRVLNMMSSGEDPASGYRGRYQHQSMFSTHICTHTPTHV